MIRISPSLLGLSSYTATWIICTCIIRLTFKPSIDIDFSVTLRSVNLNMSDMGLEARKPVFGGLVNNKDTDQPANPRRLINTFDVCTLKSISKLATSKISIFWLVSVAEQADLNLTLSETPKTGFDEVRPI